MLDIAHRAVRPGITTEEIDRIVHEACIERGAYPSPLNYYWFPKSHCTYALVRLRSCFASATGGEGCSLGR